MHMGFKQHAKRALAAAGLSSLLLALPGCQAITGSPTLTLVRVIDASTGSPGLDIYENGTALTYNMGFATQTTYIAFNPGTYKIAIDSAGTTQLLSTASATFAANKQYTVLISNVVASMAETVIIDQSSPAPSGQIALRFIHESTANGGFDVYVVPTGSTIAQTSPILTNITFGTIGNYINVPTGTYQVVLLPTGTTVTTTTVATYTGAATAFLSGSAHTFVILDEQVLNTPGAQVLIADDFESPSAASQ